MIRNKFEYIFCLFAKWIQDIQFPTPANILVIAATAGFVIYGKICAVFTLQFWISAGRATKTKTKSTITHGGRTGKKCSMVNSLIFVHKNINRNEFQKIKIRPSQDFEKRPKTWPGRPKFLAIFVWAKYSELKEHITKILFLIGATRAWSSG